MRPTRNKTPFKKPQRNGHLGKDTVKVFCRVRPMQHDNDVSCITILSQSTVRLIPPESAVNFKCGVYKETQCTFKQVFDEKSTQKNVFDVVALPLVENLIQGKNGLLFTYGVTGSGKTFTMTGESSNGGIMPRCLDVLFNSISDFLAKKYTFKPDKMNGFDVQNESDAYLDRQNELYSHMVTPKTPKMSKRKDFNSDPDLRMADSTKLSCVDEDTVYSVFVTYIEIYNNNTYDLLEEGPEDSLRTRTLQNRIIREDGNRNMYVHGVTEIEVKSTEEAFEVFYRGQKRKRMAHTNLNAESSRSHSVFTIRLVQAPLDGRGDAVLQDKGAICVSQLSLVDLAGSERTNRTKNTGQRLREAGNINNSLMTLRSCLEILRENQLQGTTKMVPYRDSRITHLFKNYFDGEGQVTVIVCVNPRSEDYDETLQVMKFAELTQEVQVTRPMQSKLELGLTPGRRRANQIFKQAIQCLDQDGKREAVPIDLDIGVVYSLGSQFPNLELNEAETEFLIKDLVDFLEIRMKKKLELLADLPKRQEHFRNLLTEMEKENIFLKQECNSLKATLDQERKKTNVLESKAMNLETQLVSLQRNLNEKNTAINALQQEVGTKDMMLKQRVIEKEQVKQKYSNKIVAETEKMSKEMQHKLRMQKAELKSRMKDKEEKLRKVKMILDENLTPVGNLLTTKSDSDLSSAQTKLETNGASAVTPCSSKLRSVSSVKNTRHRRSCSAGGDVWIDHRPAIPAELGTVMQPQMKKRKSITKLTDIKDVTDPKASKYCLMTQEQDSAGEIETRLYKGDVVPTVGGGAQVIFSDVETLKQQSPTSSPTRKRSVNPEHLDLETVCSVSIEGHAKRPRF